MQSHGPAKSFTQRNIILTFDTAPHLTCLLSCEICLGFAQGLVESLYTQHQYKVVAESGNSDKYLWAVVLRALSPVLISMPQQVDQANSLKSILNDKIAGTSPEIIMHTSTHIIDKALEYARAQKADSIVMIGVETCSTA